MRHQPLPRAAATLAAAGALFDNRRYRAALDRLAPLLNAPDAGTRSEAVSLAVACHRQLHELEAALGLIERSEGHLTAPCADRMLVHRAGILNLQGRWEAAIAAYDAYMTSSGAAASEWAPDCYLGLGWCYGQLGRHEQAGFLAAKAAQGYRRQGRREARVGAYLVLAQSSLATRDLRHTRRVTADMLRHLRGHPDCPQRPRVHLACARLALAEGDYPAAAGHLAAADKNLDLAQAQHRGDFAWICYYRGRLAGDTGRRTEAVQQARQALSAARGLTFGSELRTRAAALLREQQV